MRVLAIAFCLVVTGCEMKPSQPAPSEPMPVAGSCGAADLQGLQGRPVTDLPANGQWSTLRVIRPGMMVTMDYSATRLNVQVDARKRIVDLSCG